jgi:polyhydroxyalkanoate synthesis regulator phasin
MELFESLRKLMYAGFGAQDKVKEFIDELVKKGELSESQGAKLVKEWTDKAEKNKTDISQFFSDSMAKALEKMNIPTKEDVKTLSKEIKSLSTRLKKLEEKS